MRYVLVVLSLILVAGLGFVIGKREGAQKQPAEVAGTRKPLSGLPKGAVRVPQLRATRHEADSGEQDVELAARVEELETKLAFQDYLIEGTKKELYGEVEDWPETSDDNDKFTPDSFRQNTLAAVAECSPPADIVKMECDEPPCIAALRPTGEDWYGSFVNNCPRWSETYGKAVTMAEFEVDCPDGRKEHVALLSPFWKEVAAPADEQQRENHSKRLNVRWSRLRAEWECQPAQASDGS